MLLKEYLLMEKLSVAVFAKRIGTTRMQVWRYLNGAIPRPEAMARIVGATGGQVTPNDFYSLPALSSGMKIP